MIHPQLQQLINLLLLLLLGKYVADIYLSWEYIILLLLFTFVVEHTMLYIKNEKFPYFSYSSLSTAIGVMLMMVTPYVWMSAVAILVGLAQKHFFTYKDRHFFNPSNMALMVGMLFFYKDAHIVLGQLGENFWLGSIVILLGMAILYRVKRWVIPLSFILIYLLLEYLFIVSNDPVLIMEEVYYRFYSVSFMVFILFMLTDPKTTPKHKMQQILFSFMVAAVATLFDYLYGFRVQHLFMSLFLVSPIVPILEQKMRNRDFVLLTIVILLLALSAIIYIENQPPYYYEMVR